MLEAGQVEPKLFQIWKLRLRGSGWFIILDVLIFDVIPLVFWSLLGFFVVTLAVLIPNSIAVIVGVACLLMIGVCIFLPHLTYERWHIVVGRISWESDSNGERYYASALTRTQQPIRIELDERVLDVNAAVSYGVHGVLLLYNPENPQKDVLPFTYEKVCNPIIMMMLAWVALGSLHALWFWAIEIVVGIPIFFTRLGFIPFHFYRHYRLRADRLI